MNQVNTIVETVLSMGCSNIKEAEDMVIALYGHLHKTILADAYIELEKHFNE